MQGFAPWSEAMATDSSTLGQEILNHASAETDAVLALWLEATAELGLPGRWVRRLVLDPLQVSLRSWPCLCSLSIIRVVIDLFSLPSGLSGGVSHDHLQLILSLLSQHFPSAEVFAWILLEMWKGKD